jgi:hypothetical protein
LFKIFYPKYPWIFLDTYGYIHYPNKKHWISMDISIQGSALDYHRGRYKNLFSRLIFVSKINFSSILVATTDEPKIFNSRPFQQAIIRWNRTRNEFRRAF